MIKYKFKELIKLPEFLVPVKKGSFAHDLYQETIYKEPIQQANYYARILKKDKKWDLVICLSHLGLKYNNQKISDIRLAQQTKNIDLIIGGHTHTFLPQPLEEKNLDGEKTLINQVGWGGINIGRIDFIFGRKKTKKEILSNVISIKNNKKAI